MDVKVGQIWKDNDKRSNRWIEILSIDIAEGKVYVYGFEAARHSWVSLSRFDINNKSKARGYSLVKDVKQNA